MPSSTNAHVAPQAWDLPGGDEIRQTLAEVHSHRQGLEAFVEGLLANIEELHRAVQDRERDLALQRAQLDQQRTHSGQIEQLLDLHESRFQAVLSELASVREEQSQERERFASGRGDVELRAMINQLQAERDDLRQRLDVCREELAKRADVSEELSQTRSELSQARASLLEMREQLSNTFAASSPASQHEQERVALETELELVRRRASDLTESLVEQKDHFAQQQVFWSTELKHLRQLLESQTVLPTSRPPEVLPQGPPAGHHETAAHEVAGEEPRNAAQSPVVDSIMAQFEKLQKDVAQRRRRKLT